MCIIVCNAMRQVTSVVCKLWCLETTHSQTGAVWTVLDRFSEISMLLPAPKREKP